uniref:26S proteasome complex subunit SEM1 n=2 Tax=Anopheles atroparvus TaxID=41427 RepID=A0A182IWT9_ANOAO
LIRHSVLVEPLQISKLIEETSFVFIMSDKENKDKPKLDLGLLEEDDEFEEFPAEDWVGNKEDEEELSVWEDNWDDDNVEDDFNQQLRAQLEKHK